MNIKVKSFNTVFFFVLILAVACKEQPSKKAQRKILGNVNSTAKRINNYAMSLDVNFSNNRDSLIKAESLLDSALKIDSSYNIILNKITVEDALGNRSESITLCEKIIHQKKLGFYPFLLQGNIYQRMHNNQMAENSYMKAISILKAKKLKDCNNLYFLVTIYLARDKKDSVTFWLKECKNLNCNNYEQIANLVRGFKKDDYLYGY